MTSYSFPIEISPLARWVVEFDYSPGSPGSNYGPNGDPGDPPEPEEFEIGDIRLEIRETPGAAWVPIGVSLDEELVNGDYIETLCMAEVERRQEDHHINSQIEQWELSRE